MKLVVFPIGGGYVWMRCERHAPPSVQQWLQFPEPPGFLTIQEVPADEAEQRCVECLAESIARSWVTDPVSITPKDIHDDSQPK